MATTSDADRYALYQGIVRSVLAKDSFSLKELHEELTGTSPASVTRVVRELEDSGYLRETDKRCFAWTEKKPSFSPEAWLEQKVYGPRLTRTPAADRPRERLLAYGAAPLRTAELLAILIRSGRPGESALQAGEKIAARFSDSLDQLADAGRGELKNITPAVAQTAYCQIMAGIELGRRVERAVQSRANRVCNRINSVADAIDFCSEKFRRLVQEGKQEEFWIICLDTKHHVLSTYAISVGLLNESLVAPREVFRHAIRDAAAAVILVHNHPSGDPTPSAEDLAVTRRLQQAADTIGIDLLDHIIVARQGCVSLREKM